MNKENIHKRRIKIKLKPYEQLPLDYLAIIIRAILWFGTLQVTVNLVLQVNRRTTSFRVLVMKSFNFVWCPFEPISVVEFRVVIYTNPFDLVL
jgi:hypothetical protein